MGRVPSYARTLVAERSNEMRILIIIFCLFISAVAVIYAYIKLPNSDEKQSELDKVVEQKNAQDNEEVFIVPKSIKISSFDETTLDGLEEGNEKQALRTALYWEDCKYSRCVKGRDKHDPNYNSEMFVVSLITVAVNKKTLQIMCKKGEEIFQTAPPSNAIYFSEITIFFEKFYDQKDIRRTAENPVLEPGVAKPCQEGNALNYDFKFSDKNDGVKFTHDVQIEKLVIDTANFGRFSCTKRISMPGEGLSGQAGRPSETFDSYVCRGTPAEKQSEEEVSEVCQKEPWLCEQHD